MDRRTTTGKMFRPPFWVRYAATSVLMNMTSLPQNKVIGALQFKQAAVIDCAGKEGMWQRIARTERRRGWVRPGMLAKGKTEIPIYPFLLSGKKEPQFLAYLQENAPQETTGFGDEVLKR